MSVLDRLFSVGPIRKAIWQAWYPYLTRRLREQDVRFLNYAYQTDPASTLDLDPEDEPDRACIQLYDHVLGLAGEGSLTGKRVLEVSCGHGGGASWIARTHRPESYVGLDLNQTGIAFCQDRHAEIDGLSFVCGDACDLPFEDNSFDVVINVEASHCYPDFPRFLDGVARVLRPDGRLHYADFRFDDQLTDWDDDLDNASLEVISTRDISPEVLRGMALNAERSEALVRNCLPGPLSSLGRDFAGVPGGKVHEALNRDEMSYRSLLLAHPKGS